MLFRSMSESHLWHSLRQSVTTMVALLALTILVVGAVFSPWLAPTNPFDVASLDLLNASMPPSWMPGGDFKFLLGTDAQGRDMLSAIMFGMRISLIVGLCSVALAMAIGLTLGLTAGYAGGSVDAFIMRFADVQLAFPSILLALLISGIARSTLSSQTYQASALWVVVLAIGLSTWVLFARPVRAACMVEKTKDYVHAARLLGLGRVKILLRHILPNVLGSVLVIATLGLGVSVLIEASLSFLGVGMPPTQPSLGTLVSSGREYIAAGEWWMTLFPALTVAILVLSVNLLGDWLRDALNPRLRLAR
jgi:peptide/nickel transport system permease protein